MDSSIIQLVSTQVVKPYQLTPPSLRTYNLSLLDQLMSRRYNPIAFFFPNHQKYSPEKTRIILQESLSKALVSYYPFAGRLKGNDSIDCNDEGATFLEARINCLMSELLEGGNTIVEDLDIVFPSGLPWSYTQDGSPLVVAQLSHFDCGGTALSLCLPQKIADGCTVSNFLTDWASIAYESSEKASPQFIGASFLTRPSDGDVSIEPVLDEKEWPHCVTGRFLFDKERIDQLKAKASAEAGVRMPTNTEVISALIYKSAMEARSFKPSVFGMLVNLRPLIGPPISQNYAGNLISKFYVSTNEDDVGDTNFSGLVRRIRRAKLEFLKKHRRIDPKMLASATMERARKVKELQCDGDMDEYECTSLCSFPFYQIDFGWGKPSRVHVGTNSFKNFLVLMENHDNVGGGIEALVTLDEEVMSFIRSDPEFVRFAAKS